MQSDRNVPLSDNPQGQAKNGANLLLAGPPQMLERIVKKPLAAVLLGAVTIGTLTVPAGAAVPKRPATDTIACNDGSGRSAQVWSWDDKLAAKNPCRSEWLVMPFGQQYANGAWDNALELAPGAHFNWSSKQVAAYLPGNRPSGGMLAAEKCNGISEGSPTVVYSYKDVRPDEC
jgi:hypothetical protein